MKKPFFHKIIRLAFLISLIIIPALISILFTGQYPVTSIMWAKPYQRMIWTDYSITYGDLNHDGHADLIISPNYGIVQAVNGKTGQVLWETRIHGNISSHVSPSIIADINNDKQMEVLVGIGYQKYYALNGQTGSVIWEIDFLDSLYTIPILSDMNNDGYLDLVVVNEVAIGVMDLQSLAYLWLMRTPQKTKYGAVADVDNDGDTEIIVGYNNGSIYCYNGVNGSRKWKTTLEGSISISNPIIIDSDHNGISDIIVSTYTTKNVIYSLNGKNGKINWSYEFIDENEDMMRRQRAPDIAIGDIDKDNKPEVVGVSFHRLFTLNPQTGQEKWNKEMTKDIHLFESIIAITDVNNNEQADILIKAVDRSFRTAVIAYEVFFNNPFKLWSFNSLQVSSVFIIDLDHDGHNELFVATYYGYYALKIAHSGGLIEWVQNGNSYNTWNYDLNDVDGDKLILNQENMLGTNPEKQDTDNDGVNDYWEYRHGLNPSLADSNNDYDKDGLTNLQEYKLDTDPKQKDTDHDLLPDNIETKIKTSPTQFYEPTGIILILAYIVVAVYFIFIRNKRYKRNRKTNAIERPVGDKKRNTEKQEI